MDIMNLDDLDIFIDVAIQGSFSKAAAIHDLAQPTITLKIQAIEKQLGVDLFDRKRPLGLTAAGDIFFGGAKKLVEDYRVLVNSVSDYGDRVVGHVQVVAIYSVGLLKMEECLKEFHERYRDAKVDIRYEHPEQVLNLVLNGTAQIGILSFPEEKRDLVVTQWQDQPLVLVVPPKHRLASHKTIPVESLDGEAFIAFTSELTIRKRIDKWLREQHVVVNVVRQFDNIGAIKEGVGAGSGVAILPAPTVCTEVEAGHLVAIPFSNVSWARPLGIIHRRQRSTPTSVQKFIELLTEKSHGSTASLVSALRPASQVPPVAVESISGNDVAGDGTLENVLSRVGVSGVDGVNAAGPRLKPAAKRV
jgi:DNA-binding transcriptional LysR family regulator